MDAGEVRRDEVNAFCRVPSHVLGRRGSIAVLPQASAGDTGVLFSAC